MSNERAATHAPKTELPTLTEHDEQVLRWMFGVGDSRPDFTFADRDEAFGKVLTIARALVSGEAKLVPTATHRAVSVEGLKALRSFVWKHLDGEHRAYAAINTIDRWLTPEDER